MKLALFFLSDLDIKKDPSSVWSTQLLCSLEPMEDERRLVFRLPEKLVLALIHLSQLSPTWSKIVDDGTWRITGGQQVVQG